MKTLLLFIIKKFLTPEKIAKLIAGIIADLLIKASKHEKWDLVKAVIDKTENACHLFNEVYADETIDKNDERLIAEAIAGMTEKIDIASILGK